LKDRKGNITKDSSDGLGLARQSFFLVASKCSSVLILAMQTEWRRNKKERHTRIKKQGKSDMRLENKKASSNRIERPHSKKRREDSVLWVQGGKKKKIKLAVWDENCADQGVSISNYDIWCHSERKEKKDC
jgi:hypothetical protein